MGNQAALSGIFDVPSRSPVLSPAVKGRAGILSQGAVHGLFEPRIRSTYVSNAVS